MSKYKILTVSILIILFIISILFTLKLKSSPTSNSAVSDTTVLPSLIFIKKKSLAYNADINAKQVFYSDIDVPQVVNTSVNNNVEQINNSIMNNFKRSQCPDLDIENTNKVDIYNSIDSIYQDAVSRLFIKKIPINPSKEDKLKYIQESGFAANWYATTTRLNKSVLSLAVSMESDCGGAHPNYSRYGLNYFLNKDNGISTSTEIIIKYLFNNYSKDKYDIEKIILREVDKQYVDQQDCIAEIKNEYDGDLDLNNYSDGNNEIYPFKFSLSSNSLSILSFGLPHAMGACEPDSMAIPYDDFSKYLNPKFLKLVK